MNRRFRSLCFFVIGCLIAANPNGLMARPQGDAVSSDQRTAEEMWLGTLDAGVAKLRLALYLSRQEDGSYGGRVVSLDQQNATIPCDSVVVNDAKIQIKMSTAFAKFEGTYNEDRNELAGTWSQAGRNFPLRFQRADKIPSRELIEAWRGTLIAGPQKFAFQLRLLREEGGESLIGELDSFNEGINGIPVELQKTENGLTFKINLSGAEFEGQFAEAGEKLKGFWKQGAGKFPLEFEKIPLEKVHERMIDRPQTPQPPYRFREVELSIPTVAEVVISGTLATPKNSEGPFPVVVTVTGSGPQDRDETLFDHKLFLVLTDALTERGIAVFRYDERGVGKSTGDYFQSNTKDFAEDVGLILDHLAQRPEIDRRRMAILGHSEGGIVAPMVAARRSDLAAIVLLAGTSVPGEEILLDQSRAMARVSGASEKILDAQEELLRRAIREVLRPEQSDALEKSQDSPRKPAEGEAIGGVDAETIEKALSDPANFQALVAQFSTPWMRFFLGHDPAQDLRLVKCPTLALFGEKDLQVTPALNVPGMRAALEAAGNPDVEIFVFDGLNHLFQRCDTGLMTEYASISETIDRAALEKIGDWLEARLVPRK